jgi:hypothetical protein
MLFSTSLFSEEEKSLKEVVKDYQSFKKDLDAILQNQKHDCLPGTKPDPTDTFCSMKDFCARQEINIDSPVLYQNNMGEKIINNTYYRNRADLRSCLKEKYAGEIKVKREVLAIKLGIKHLKKIMDTNKKLNQLADKYNEGAKIQKISAEILTMSLEIGMKAEDADWDKERIKRGSLTNFITRAEKRTKLTLNPEIKSWLVELQYLKTNHLYRDEVDAVEQAMFPEEKPKDPFYDWTLLTDEKAAGGKKALEANRARMVKKTQDAYDVFQETQKELSLYLEGKKAAGNEALIDRVIQRVKTIRFNPPRLTGQVTKECKNPNAFYNQSNHSFTICPQLLDMPKMTLMEVMAHELAHSFDSCSLSGKMFSKKGPIIVQEAPFEIDIAAEPIIGNYKIITTEPELSGIGTKLQDKMPYSDNPFSKALSCLQDSKSVNAQAIKPEELLKKAREKLNELTKSGQNNPDNIEARYLNFLTANQEEFFKYYQGCDGPSTHSRSQMEEAFSDKIASEVIARKLKQVSKAEAEKSMLEIGLLYGECTDHSKGKVIIRDYAIKEGCKDYFDNMTAEQKILTGLKIADPDFDTHSEASKRVDTILLAHPEIRKALNCAEDKGIKYCE